MNLSGKAVAAILQFYKLSPDQLLVISDDIDMEFGKIRLRKNWKLWMTKWTIS